MTDREPIRLGIDLGGTKIEGIALDARGRTLAGRRVATPREDYAGTVAAVTGLVAALEDEVGARGSVGVGIPGAVSPMTGRIKNANSTWLIGATFNRDLAQNTFTTDVAAGLDFVVVSDDLGRRVWRYDSSTTLFNELDRGRVQL